MIAGISTSGSFKGRKNCRASSLKRDKSLKREKSLKNLNASPNDNTVIKVNNQENKIRIDRSHDRSKKIKHTDKGRAASFKVKGERSHKKISDSGKVIANINGRAIESSLTNRTVRIDGRGRAVNCKSGMSRGRGRDTDQSFHRAASFKESNNDTNTTSSSNKTDRIKNVDKDEPDKAQDEYQYKLGYTPYYYNPNTPYFSRSCRCNFGHTPRLRRSISCHFTNTYNKNAAKRITNATKNSGSSESILNCSNRQMSVSITNRRSKSVVSRPREIGKINEMNPSKITEAEEKKPHIQTCTDSDILVDCTKNNTKAVKKNIFKKLLNKFKSSTWSTITTDVDEMVVEVKKRSSSTSNIQVTSKGLNVVPEIDTLSFDEGYERKHEFSFELDEE